MMKKKYKQLVFSKDHLKAMEVLGKPRNQTPQELMENLLEYKVWHIVAEIDESSYYSQVYGEVIKDIRKLNRKFMNQNDLKNRNTFH